MKKYTYIDLFAGAGGLTLGAFRAGFNVGAAVEIDPYAIETHRSNFPHTVHIQEDITALTGATILEKANIQREELVGVIGGPPCQGFSSIGRGDVNDSRNKLFIKFFEIVAELQPIFFLAENVPGIMNDKYNETRQLAFSKIQDYKILPPLLINASDYGAPTTRTRYFFIGFRDCEHIQPLNIADFEHNRVPLESRTNVRTALEGLQGDIRYTRTHKSKTVLAMPYYMGEHIQSDFYYERITALIPENVGNENYVHEYQFRHIVNGCIATKHTENVRARFARLRFNEQDTISKCKRLDPDGYCPTLRAGTGPDKGSYQAVRPVHFEHNRVITPREAARLQGFPDWFKLPETIWHSFRQIGNSVSPIAAEMVLSAIYQKLTL